MRIGLWSWELKISRKLEPNLAKPKEQAAWYTDLPGKPQRLLEIGQQSDDLAKVAFVKDVFCWFLQSIYKCTQLGDIIIGGGSALVAFLLAIINYCKLDACAEAMKITAHQYDKLQTFVEFQSGNTLLFSNPILTNTIKQWEEQKNIIPRS